MKMKNTVVLMIVVVAVATIVAVFSAVSCSEHTDKEHVRDMVLAENPGLKGILELYQEDSLKYEAALFLIDNMGYYQGADSGELNSMYKAYEIFSTGRYTYRQALDLSLIHI
mgnify:FL=1